MELFTQTVAPSLEMSATVCSRSGVPRRSATLALILVVFCVYFAAASPTRLRRHERLGHSRIPRTVLRTILSNDLSPTLSSLPHTAAAWACQGLRFEIRQSGITIGQDFRISISEVEDFSRRDRSPPQV
jgi:hypothetical protein